jgi:hypothetical protein
MKNLRLYGAGLLAALLLALVIYISGRGAGGGGGGGSESRAGTTWTARTMQDKSLKGVTYGNGLFVVVGDGGAILTSPDGVSWTQRTPQMYIPFPIVTYTLTSVTYGNGLGQVAIFVGFSSAAQSGPMSR